MQCLVNSLLTHSNQNIRLPILWRFKHYYRQFWNYSDYFKLFWDYDSISMFDIWLHLFVKPCIQNHIHNFWTSSNYRPHDFHNFRFSKHCKLIPSISPVRDECCIIILWKTCSTFGSYLPETVVELRKFFCCSFLNFDLLLAQLSFPHSCRRWKYEYCFCENISHAKKTLI